MKPRLTQKTFDSMSLAKTTIDNVLKNLKTEQEVTETNKLVNLLNQ